MCSYMQNMSRKCTEKIENRKISRTFAENCQLRGIRRNRGQRRGREIGRTLLGLFIAN